MSRNLGTAINNNFDNAAATPDTRIVGGNNGSNNFFSFDIDTLSSLFQGLSLSKNANSPLQLNIYNSSDTSGAKSEIYLTVEGEAAGDAALTFNINGGDLVRMGMDNSDANAFVMALSNALGANNVFRIGQDGVPSFPMAPLGFASGGTNAITALAAIRNLAGSVNSQSGATYTAAAATDAFQKTLLTNAAGCTITINDSSFANGDEAIYQRGSAAGNITFVAGGGVTINSSPYQSLVIASPNGRVGLWKTATNTYYIAGDLTP